MIINFKINSAHCCYFVNTVALSRVKWVEKRIKCRAASVRWIVACVCMLYTHMRRLFTSRSRCNERCTHGGPSQHKPATQHTGSEYGHGGRAASRGGKHKAAVTPGPEGAQRGVARDGIDLRAVAGCNAPQQRAVAYLALFDV